MLSLLLPGRVAKYCNEYVCLCVLVCVCLHALLQNYMAKPHQIFSACCLWPWLSPLTVLQYVMYFRFYGWCHVIIPTDRIQHSGPEDRLSPSLSYASVITTSPEALGTKPAIYDCLVYICFKLVLLPGIINHHHPKFRETTTTTTTILWPPGLCLRLPGWTGTRKVKPGM